MRRGHIVCESHSSSRHLLLPPMYNAATRREGELCLSRHLSSFPPRRCLLTRPRESTIAHRPSPSSTTGVASTSGMKRLPRTRKSIPLAEIKSRPVRHACHLLREYDNPSISHTLVSRAIIRRVLDAPNKLRITFITYIFLSSSPLRGKTRTG